MKIVLRVAGVNERAEQRLRMACKLLEANGYRIAIDPWDGTKCDVLVVDGQDTYGLHALGIARRRSVSTIALTSGPVPSDVQGGQFLDQNEPVLSWVQTLQYTLSERAIEPKEPGPNRDASASAIGLCRLAQDPDLKSMDLLASFGDRRMIVSVSKGRVIAKSEADLLQLRSQLAETGWNFSPLSGAQTDLHGISASLDSFYTEGALAAAEKLPLYSSEKLRLLDWPDLGAAIKFVGALTIAKILLQRQADMHSISEETKIDLWDVSACLWAFAASGLLHSHAAGAGHAISTPATQPAKTSRKDAGLFARLAERFGLVLQRN